MSNHTKNYTDVDLFLEASEVMDEFQLLHNILRNDYIALLNLTEKNIGTEAEFNTLYNSCLIRLFTMIEADLFGLSKLDPYPKIKPKENFFDQFTNTFNQVCSTWNKLDIKEKYLSTHFGELLSIKKLRNSFVHPSKRSDVPPATVSDFERIKTAFNNYNEYMSAITDQFFIGIDAVKFAGIDLADLLERKKAKGLQINK